MRSSGLLALASLIAVSCFAQHPARTGTGYTGFGSTGFGVPPGAAHQGGAGHGRGGGAYGNGYGRRAVVAPVYVAVPVYGGYGYGCGYGSDYTDNTPDQQAPDQPAPSVIINQNFVPDHANPVTRDVPDSGSGDVESFQAPGPPPMEPPPSEMGEASSDQPTIYLIAFRDHSIMPALAYWTEGNMLKYVNMDHGINQATLDLVDRDMSRLLNEQRSVEFRLPTR